MSIAAPMTLKGTAVPPVSCLSHPKEAGPAQPPKLPKAFTRPIAAPTMLAGMVSGKIAKNGARPANGPWMAKQRKKKDSQNECLAASTLAMRQTPLKA